MSSVRDNVKSDPYAAGELDGDGLPFPDNETISQWRAEARQALPHPEDWADFAAMLRHAAELDRRGIEHPDLPEGLTGCQYALFAVINFLGNQPAIALRGDVASLARLHAAIVDLAAGRPSSLFKPKRRAPGSPGKGVTHALTQAYAARALSELIQGGVRIQEAAARIAKAVAAGRKDMKRITAKTIINWREQLMRGPGRGAPTDACRIFNDPLPADYGTTPIERGNNLVKALKKRGGTVG
jgi:hypothetical protein